MSRHSAEMILQGSTTVIRGNIMEITPEGAILVAKESDIREVIPCEVLRTGPVAPTIEPGDDVIFLLAGDNSERGYILGVIEQRGLRTPGLSTSESAGEDLAGEQTEPPSRLVIEGKEEVILRTGRATIVLRANGDVEIRGKRIVSRASEIQKLSAPMLKLN
jgi:hypothetical protein